MKIVQLDTPEAVAAIARALQTAPKSQLLSIAGKDRLKREEAIERLAGAIHARMTGEGGAILQIHGRMPMQSPSTVGKADPR